MILIMGATGKVGVELVKKLSADRIRARALVRTPSKAAHLAALPNIEIAQGDLGDPPTLDAALKGVDKAFLLSSPDPRQAELQGNFIKAAQRAGLKHIVKLSAAGATLDAPMILARMHAETEKHLQESGIPFISLQPTHLCKLSSGTSRVLPPRGPFTRR